MPKYGIHYIVLEEVISKLDSDSSNAKSKNFAEILQKNRFEAALGAIGPDLLFWAPDYEIVKELENIVKAYDLITEKIEQVEEVTDVIKEKIDAGIDAVVEGLSRLPIIGEPIAAISDWVNLFKEIQRRYDVIFSAIGEEVIQSLFIKLLGLDGSNPELTTARSLFQGLFQSGKQIGREEMEWYWFEMLHYRNTGDFTKNLIKNAEQSGSDAQKAYAYAYVTHYATDLVGHPFVNTICGAPYRMSVQRHALIENYMDQWKWFNHYGKNIRNDLYNKFDFHDTRELPDEIANLIADTIKETYKKVVHPLIYPTVNKENSSSFWGNNFGFLKADDIKTAYRFQRNILRFLGGRKETIKPDEPYPGANADLADLLAQTNVFDPPPAFPGLPSGVSAAELSNYFDELFSAIKELIIWLAETISKAMELAAKAVEEWRNSPNLPEQTQKAIQLVNYWVQLQLYDFYRAIHQVMSLAGLAYPEPDDVRLTADDFARMPETLAQSIKCLGLNNSLAEQLITTGHCYKEGKCGCNDEETTTFNYPILRYPGQSHLVCASYIDVDVKLRSQSTIKVNSKDVYFSHFENPTTVSSFYKKESTPNVFISQTEFNKALFSKYAEAETPEDTRKLYQKFKGQSFGNAIDISVYILLNAKNEAESRVVFCNWDLDGDRGYGYKTWDGVPFTAIEGEIKGVYENNEDIGEFNLLCSSVWSGIKVKEEEEEKLIYCHEKYTSSKKPTDTILSTMQISESNIPPGLTRSPYNEIENYRDRLVPPRFLLQNHSFKENFVFVNGLTTPPSAGMRATMAFQRTLNAAFGLSINEGFKIQYFHNYSDLKCGDLYSLFDLIEAILGDYLYAKLATDAINNHNSRLPDMTNPTQIALVALLHKSMDHEEPLLVSGHSQGAMITGNAILTFSSMSSRHASYLKDHVRLIHFEPEILIPVRELIREKVSKYLVYIMNNADPCGTDPLPELLSGYAPGIPYQSAALALNSNQINNFKNLLSNPDLLNFKFYKGLLSIINDSGGDLLKAIQIIQSLDIRSLSPHFIPRQLSILKEDIVNNRFRTDPGTLPDPTVQLSTVSRINTKSNKVREFFED